MKKAFVLLMAFVIILCSCKDGLFGTNIFAGLESYSKPNIENATVYEIIEAFKDPRFVESLTEDEVVAVNNKLKTTYTDTNKAPSDRAAAALVAADIQYKTSDVDDSLKKMNEIMGDIVSGDSPNMDIEYLLNTFFGDQSVDTTTKKINALVEASNAYNAYGDALQTDQKENILKDDDNPVDTAVKAIISGVVAEIIELNPGISTTEVATAIVGGKIQQNLNIPEYTKGATVKENLTKVLGGDQKANNILVVVEAGIDLGAFDD